MLTFPFNNDVKFTLLPKHKGVKINQSDMVGLKVTIENKSRGINFVPIWKWNDIGIEVEIQRENIPVATTYNVVLDWRKPDGSFSDDYQDLFGQKEIQYIVNASPNDHAIAIIDAFPSFKGDPGVGVPAGGTPGQALVKKTSDDFDTEWKTLSAGTGTGDGNDGKTPVIGSITAESVAYGEQPSFSLTHTSNDGDGNPVYTGTIKIPKGKDGVDGDDGNDGNDGIDGKTPIFEIGTVETLAAGSQATASIVENGVDAQGNPKYKVNFGIPKGANGTGGGGGTVNLAWEDIEGKPSWIGVTKPTYTATEVGALPTAHNSDTEAHGGIATKVTTLEEKVQTLEGNVPEYVAPEYGDILSNMLYSLNKNPDNLEEGVPAKVQTVKAASATDAQTLYSMSRNFFDENINELNHNGLNIKYQDGKIWIVGKTTASTRIKLTNGTDGAGSAVGPTWKDDRFLFSKYAVTVGIYNVTGTTADVPLPISFYLQYSDGTYTLLNGYVPQYAGVGSVKVTEGKTLASVYLVIATNITLNVSFNVMISERAYAVSEYEPYKQPYELSIPPIAENSTITLNQDIPVYNGGYLLFDNNTNASIPALAVIQYSVQTNKAVKTEPVIVPDITKALEGLNVAFLGASSIATEGRFADIAAEMAGFTAIRYGVSGARLARASGRTDSMIERFPDMSINMDYIIVHGGTNDWSGLIPIGTMASTEDTTFYGALKVLAAGLQAKYPRGRVVFMTPFCRQNGYNTNSNGTTLVEFVKAVQEVGARYGIPVLDTFTTLGFNPDDAAQRSIWMVDGLHPTNAGYTRIAKLLVNYMIYLGK